ncbi:ATP-binding cassette domain-containing protein [bacterium]|nr:ATP-binding cassette domain-containing protein [bacterium]
MASYEVISGNSSVIELTGVHVLYGRTCALDVERLEIGKSERVFVLGRSGAGKTTLLRIIKGRLKPSTGCIRVMGSDPASQQAAERRAVQRRIAMVDQEFFLVPRSSVVGNVLNGCLGRVSPLKSLIGWYPVHEWEKAQSILREVELDGFGGRRVETLSGGQRQRTAIARALMQDADVILADEPVSNLDPELTEDALQLLVDCAQRRGVTLLVSLHQPILAQKFATRLIGLSAGKVVYDGEPAGLTEELAGFIYNGNGGEDIPRKKEIDDEPQETMVKDAPGPNLRLLGG